jgi:hypothetical protein
MKRNLPKATVAASAFALAALFSFGWSEQSGVSLSIEKAEARVGRPLTPVSVAGVARRQYRRSVLQRYRSRSQGSLLWWFRWAHS